MTEKLQRTELIFGKKLLDELRQAKVIVFGLGGVGSYVTEALARGGIGNIDICDGDKIDKSNINRQLIALNNNVGEYKTVVTKERILQINSDINVKEYTFFYDDCTYKKIDLKQYTYIVDAIDMISSKILLIDQAKKAGTKIISCMGTGNKLDATNFQVDDIYNTSVCPIARILRKELKIKGIDNLKVVYSKEQPIKTDNITKGKSTPGSVSFVPPVAGMILAGEVIKEIVKWEGDIRTKKYNLF